MNGQLGGAQRVVVVQVHLSKMLLLVKVLASVLLNSYRVGSGWRLVVVAIDAYLVSIIVVSYIIIHPMKTNFILDLLPLFLGHSTKFNRIS